MNVRADRFDLRLKMVRHALAYGVKPAASVCLLSRLLCEHLRNCGIGLKDVKFQTDNNSELIGHIRGYNLSCYHENASKAPLSQKSAVTAFINVKKGLQTDAHSP